MGMCLKRTDLINDVIFHILRMYEKPSINDYHTITTDTITGEMCCSVCLNIFLPKQISNIVDS
jgi:hypothetical protein